jgi:hypothetical protein
MSKDIQSIQVSLLQLLTNIKLGVQTIVIPIIQRDYAQGREEENEVRTNFLENLKSYIMDNKKESHDLDFVYGNLNTDKEFIPLDGQQRLTTLFLLHYYLSINDGRFCEFQSVFLNADKHSRFQYQTRLSSTDFCNALVNNPIDIPSNQEIISANIQNLYPWFSDSWIYDPTIMSMLTMLDAIHTCFHGQEGLYQRLIDTLSPAITFQVLYMSESGLTDDLYIKMNSRGLELTPFENLKAHIIKRLKDVPETRELVRTEIKGKEIVSVKDYFAFKMDINWATLFWMYKKAIIRKTDDGESYSVYDTDTDFLNFINTLVLNYKALQPYSKITNDDLSRYNELYWSYYSDVPNDFYLELIDILDIFEEDAILIESEHAGICDKLQGRSKFDICTTFKNFIKKVYSDAAYDEHIRLYAYYAYLIKHKENIDADDFYQWMRIVMNLTTNHTWQNVEDFCRSMRTIQWLNENNTHGILQLLSDERHIQNTGFNPVQFKEERIKACLLLREDASDWANSIYCAEDIPYLKGQTISILNFSEIESYFDEHKRCDWSVAENKNYLNLFHRYTHLYSYVFNADGVKSDLIGDDELFRRALLCKGDYLMGISSDRWSMVINSHRDYSWHRYLQDSNENRRIFFKELLDGFDKDKQTFKEYLEDVIRNYKSDDLNDWKYLLIKEKDVWKYFGPNKLLRFANNDNDVYILSATTMGGWHAELRTYYLFCQISKECSLKKYVVQYEYSQSWEAPYIYIQHEKEFCIGIQFLDNEWRMWIEINEENYKFTTEEESNFKMMKFEIEDDPYCYAHYESTIDIPYIQTLVDELLS